MQPHFDYLTYIGAQKLAKQIEAFWAEQGKRVRCRIEKMTLPFGKVERIASYVVRSDMVRGQPV